jgi:hypothetical protein
VTGGWISLNAIFREYEDKAAAYLMIGAAT